MHRTRGGRIRRAQIEGNSTDSATRCTVVATRLGERATSDLAALGEKHENVRTVALDVTDDISLRRLPPVAILSMSAIMQVTKWTTWSSTWVAYRSIQSEYGGLLNVVQAMLPHLNVLTVVSSQMDSVHVSNTGRSYVYRASKASANVVCKSLIIDLRSQAAERRSLGN